MPDHCDRSLWQIIVTYHYEIWLWQIIMTDHCDKSLWQIDEKSAPLIRSGLGRLLASYKHRTPLGHGQTFCTGRHHKHRVSLKCLIVSWWRYDHDQGLQAYLLANCWSSSGNFTTWPVKPSSDHSVHGGVGGWVVVRFFVSLSNWVGKTD